MIFPERNDLGICFDWSNLSIHWNGHRFSVSKQKLNIFVNFYFFPFNSFFLYHFRWNISVNCFCVSLCTHNELWTNVDMRFYQTVVLRGGCFSFWFYLQLNFIRDLVLGLSSRIITSHLFLLKKSGGKTWCIISNHIWKRFLPIWIYQTSKGKPIWNQVRRSIKMMHTNLTYFTIFFQKTSNSRFTVDHQTTNFG